MPLSNSHLPQQPAPCFRVCKPEPEAVEAGGETPTSYGHGADEAMGRAPGTHAGGRTSLLLSLRNTTLRTIPAMARCAINPALTRTPVLHCASSRPLLLHLLRRSNSLRSDPLRHFPLSCCACIALPVSLTCRFFCGNHFCNTNHHQSQFYNDSKST